jgi:hypothetical protein
MSEEKKTCDQFPDPLDAEEVVAVTDATRLLPELVGIVESYARVQKPREWIIPKEAYPTGNDCAYWTFTLLSQFGFAYGREYWVSEDEIRANLFHFSGYDRVFAVDEVRRMMRIPERLDGMLRFYETRGWVISRVVRVRAVSDNGCCCCVQ